MLPLLAALVFGVALARVSGFYTDDSYIHLVFARSIARGDGFTFNTGQPTYGFTSPLWMLLLAAGHAAIPDWLALSRVLCLLFTLLAVAATYRLAVAAGGTRGIAFGAAASLALNAWFLRWSLSGMETSLAAFLVAAGLERLIRGGRAVAVGLVVLALAALARPEALILFGAGCLWAVVRGRRLARASGQEARGPDRGWAAAGALGGLAIFAVWELCIHASTGAWFPNAYTVKRFHEAFTIAGALGNMGYFFGVVGITDAILAATAVAALWTIRRRGESAGALALLLLWPALLAAFYLGARVQMISRYWIPATPVLCAAAWVGAERAWSGAGRAWTGAGRAWGRSARSVTAGLYFAQQAAVLLFLVAPQIDAFTRGLNRGPVEIGRWLHANAPPEALVATPDIGAIGFYGERPLLDLGGLVTPAMAPILARHDVNEVIAGALYEPVGHPDYLVDRASLPGALTGLTDASGRPRYELIFSSRIENLGISRPEPRYYSLYRVRRVAAP